MKENESGVAMTANIKVSNNVVLQLPRNTSKGRPRRTRVDDLREWTGSNILDWDYTTW